MPTQRWLTNNTTIIVIKLDQVARSPFGLKLQITSYLWVMVIGFQRLRSQMIPKSILKSQLSLSLSWTKWPEAPLD